ncbi:TetR/AcrR family transcriptional regulator [Halobacillus kuroshimensis]|uniref:TetR/AcrR family transcriptional regulator n=1 Tax=Halobacillus kuroshimensis TaxID=302481 RepID=A0ABS3E0Q9_9BACI|nr:TetR/AcrR family transcriptional regulator [Halobacillus kuroshimensis]MBN8237179.1 TetR/AcrR family transcriptional regulator [Halobacillus kuroshimensis]
MGETTKMTPAARRILDTASELFYSKGIHAVGVETIASEAGVTKKTLYDRFGSKDQLIVAYLEERDQKWRKHLFSCMDEVPDDQPMDKILRIFDALENWMSTRNKRGCAFVNALAELSEETHPGRKVIIEEKKWLKELFASLLRQLQLENPDPIAEQLFILHEGLMVTYSLDIYERGTAGAKETAHMLIQSADYKKEEA